MEFTEPPDGCPDLDKTETSDNNGTDTARQSIANNKADKIYQWVVLSVYTASLAAISLLTTTYNVSEEAFAKLYSWESNVNSTSVFLLDATINGLL